MEKQTKAKTGVLARWIITLCLSLVLTVSAVYMIMSLTSIAGINDRNLRSTADVTMRYINMEIQNAIQPALDLAETTAAMIPNINDFEQMDKILVDLLPTVPAAFELYYGTSLSRFDGGNFVCATDWDPYVDNPEWDQVKRPWFITSINNPGKTVITEPYEDTSTGQICVTVVKTVSSNNQIIGVVGVDVFLDVLTDLVTGHKITNDGDTFIINKEGLYIVHKNHNFVMTRNYFTDDGYNIQWNQNSVVQVLIENDTYHAYMLESSMDWIIVTEGSTDELTADFFRTLRTTIIIGLVVSLLAVIVSLRFSKIITNPIVKLFAVLKAFAVGDFTQKIEAKSGLRSGKDEISQMSLLLKDTQESLKKLILKIKNEASTLSDIGDDLATNMNETAKAMNDITANVDSINKKVLNQSASVSETHATMEQVVSNINKVNSHVEDQSNHISQASSAIEQMVANINSVTATLVNNVENVHTLTESSEAGRTGLHEVAQDIQEIARESEGLLQINAVMENIASQTNLLSMNAAIEAAHAGEAGKGFAVVASEIRKLAESSSEQSKTIGTVLKKIKASIDKITGSTQNVMSKFEAIESSVKTVSIQEENIRNAMEEQGIGSKQILEGVGNVNELTRQVKSGSGQMLTGAKEVIKESENLEKITQEISLGMSDMTGGTKQVNTAVNHVNEISKKNREAIDTLMQEVSRFKVN